MFSGAKPTYDWKFPFPWHPEKCIYLVKLRWRNCSDKPPAWNGSVCGDSFVKKGFSSLKNKSSIQIYLTGKEIDGAWKLRSSSWTWSYILVDFFLTKDLTQFHLSLTRHVCLGYPWDSSTHQCMVMSLGDVFAGISGMCIWYHLRSVSLEICLISKHFKVGFKYFQF